MSQSNSKNTLQYCIYKTTSPRQGVQLVSKREYLKKVTLEDGTVLSIIGTGPLNYAFDNPGEHKVLIEVGDTATSLYRLFYSCKDLIEVAENLLNNVTGVLNVKSLFGKCTSLKSIPNYLFANNIKIADFSYCFDGCTSLTGTTPNGGSLELWKREGNSGYPNSIDGSFCFRNCTGLSNYNLIPSEWK